MPIQKHISDKAKGAVGAILAVGLVVTTMALTFAQGDIRTAGHGYGYSYGYGYGYGGAPQGEFKALPPTRILETRATGNTGAPVGKVGQGQTISVAVEGQGGVPNGNVCGVALNVTSTEADTPSFITVFPSGQMRPTASNLNTEVNQDVPNLVKVPVPPDGKVNIYNNAGSTHVVADVVGYFTCQLSPERGARFTGLNPARILETRATDNTGAPVGKVGQGQSRDIDVLGRGGVPASGVSAVVLNVTSTEADTPSFITVFPSGQMRPLASNLNTEVNQDIPNLTVARLGTGGKVTIYNNAGSTHLVADVVGYFGPEDGSGTGSLFTGLNPARILETRATDNTGAPVGKVGQGQTRDVIVLGRGGVPATGVDSVVINVTSTEADTPSFLTVFPSGQMRPLASNLNTEVNQDVPNLAVAKVGADGSITVYNNAGSTHVVIDVVGYYGLASIPGVTTP